MEGFRSTIELHPLYKLADFDLLGLPVPGGLSPPSLRERITGLGSVRRNQKDGRQQRTHSSALTYHPFTDPREGTVCYYKPPKYPLCMRDFLAFLSLPSKHPEKVTFGAHPSVSAHHHRFVKSAPWLFGSGVESNHSRRTSQGSILSLYRAAPCLKLAFEVE